MFGCAVVADGGDGVIIAVAQLEDNEGGANCGAVSSIVQRWPRLSRRGLGWRSEEAGCPGLLMAVVFWPLRRLHYIDITSRMKICAKGAETKKKYLGEWRERGLGKWIMYVVTGSHWIQISSDMAEKRLLRVRSIPACFDSLKLSLYTLT